MPLKKINSQPRKLQTTAPLKAKRIAPLKKMKKTVPLNSMRTAPLKKIRRLHH